LGDRFAMAHHESLRVETRGRALIDVTARIRASVERSGIRTGLATIFVHHTSASLVVQENASPDVRRDLEAFFARLVKDGDALFTHTDEGPDDMPAHVRAALTATSLGVPVAAGELDLGTWQAVYLYEHRHAPHTRRLSVVVLGDAS
jgi:secondary thiamine-phosphate synthase enzyme